MAEGENRNRVVALDVGTVRIGVAASDPTGTFAQGVTVLAASEGWQDELAGIVLRYRASKLLVGMPRRTGGDEGPEAVQMRRVAALLSERFEGLEIVTWDERFTTVIAARAMIEADESRSSRKGKIDMVAAAVLLQGYLDFQHSGNSEAPEASAAPASSAVRAGKDRRRGIGKRRKAYE